MALLSFHFLSGLFGIRLKMKTNRGRERLLRILVAFVIPDYRYTLEISKFNYSLQRRRNDEKIPDTCSGVFFFRAYFASS